MLDYTVRDHFYVDVGDMDVFLGMQRCYSLGTPL